jgi:hypothetical protein
MATFLQDQVESYAKYVNAVADQLMREHELAMMSYELEAIVAVGLGLFESYELIDAGWRRSVARSTPEELGAWADLGEGLQSMLARMLESRNHVLQLIGALELKGYVIGNATRYRALNPRPFDDRALDVPVRAERLAELAAASNREDWNRQDDHNFSADHDL